MGALLDQARARQAAGPQPAINAERECADRAVHAHVIAASRPVGVAILAWCQTHPLQVGAFGHLVENLRQALALKQLIHPHVLALWSEIPDTVEASYVVRMAV